MSESANVSVRRIDKWNAKLRKVVVKIDGDEIGSLKNGEEKSFVVTPGQRSMKVEAPWLSSNDLDFTVEPGTTAQFDYEDLSKVKYWALGLCGGIGALLTGVFGAVGFPSMTPFVAGFLLSFGGYWFLEKIGVVSPAVTYEAELRPRIAEQSSPAGSS